MNAVGQVVPAKHLVLIRKHVSESDARFAMDIELELGKMPTWTLALMEAWVNAWLLEVPTEEMGTGSNVFMRQRAPRIECEDGFNISVQAGSGNYCQPRSDQGPWTAVECGFPSEMPEGWENLGEDPNTCETVFPYIAVGQVAEVLLKHGGPR